MFEAGMMVKSKTAPLDTFGFITRVSNVLNRRVPHQIVCIRWFDPFVKEDEWSYNSIDADEFFEVINV